MVVRMWFGRMHGAMGASFEFHCRIDALLLELANPSLHDTAIPRRAMGPPHQHIRWVIAAACSVVVGHAALDAAIASYPDQRFTLRNRIQVIREHVPKLKP
jgi:hypothetical protein